MSNNDYCSFSLIQENLRALQNILAARNGANTNSESKDPLSPSNVGGVDFQNICTTVLIVFSILMVLSSWRRRRNDNFPSKDHVRRPGGGGSGGGSGGGPGGNHDHNGPAVGGAQ